MSDLVKRGRALAYHISECKTVDDVDGATVTEMADRIEALEAEVTRLHACLEERDAMSERMEAETARLREYGFAATKTITELTPGGSEYFTGTDDLGFYRADLNRCEQAIRDRFERSEARIRTALSDLRDASAALKGDT